MATGWCWRPRRTATWIACIAAGVAYAASGVAGQPVTAAAQARPATISSTKGSSCAHPYRVFWLVTLVKGKEGVEARGLPQELKGVSISNKTPGEMAGDTSVIKAGAKYFASGHETPTLAYFGASWKPVVSGLKVCTARITFDYRAPLVSHEWHRHPLLIPFNPTAEDLVTSVVITAARSPATASQASPRWDAVGG
jgi:hypothetical protein